MANKVTSKSYACHLCTPPSIHTSRAALHIHKTRFHREVYGGGGQMQDRPWDPTSDPFDEFPGTEKIRSLYDDNDVYILAPHQLENDIVKVFNFPVRGHVTSQNVELQMRYIYNHPNMQKAYKVNIAAGVILYRAKDETYRYFRPSSNAFLLNTPLSVNNKETLDSAILSLQEMDLDNLIRTWRPDSSYTVLFITQLEYYIYSSAFPLKGLTSIDDLPTFIKQNKSVVTQFPIEGYENCCLFIAIAQFLHPERDYRFMKRKVKMYLEQWRQYCTVNQVYENEVDIDPSRFSGVEFRDIPLIEDCFQICITILQLHPNKTVSSEYRTSCRYERTMYLNIYKTHLNLIKENRLGAYSHAFACRYCTKLHKTVSNCIRHERTCNKMTAFTFTGGSYVHLKNIFERLEEAGIMVPAQDRFYEHVILYDLEAILEKIAPNTENKLQFVARHRPISVAMCSSVNGFTQPYCVVNPDPQVLVNEMFAYFEQVREKATDLSMQKWGEYLFLLREKINTEMSRLQRDYSSYCRNKELEVCSLQAFFLTDPLLKQYVTLERDFRRYINQIIICHFNGQRYDVPLIANQLLSYLLANENTIVEMSENSQRILDEFEAHMQEHADIDDVHEHRADVLTEPEFAGSEEFLHYLQHPYGYSMGKTVVIKKANRYMSIANNFYNFLDILNFLPAGTSYEKFLIAFEMEDSKLKFCYEYLDSADKLTHGLPAYPTPAWYSNLRDCDLLDEAHALWKAEGRRGIEPKTGLQVYGDIQQMWLDKGFVTLKDYLQEYNCKDVEPGVIAIQKMQQEYFSQGCDLFKDAISVPGIARRKIMSYAREQHIQFPIFSRADADLHFLFKNSITGGPAQIFTRCVERGVTYLDSDSDVKSAGFTCFDANALYLYCCGGTFPSQQYVRRWESDNFKPHVNRQFYKMQIWLQHIEETENIKIKTKYSMGVECAIGPYWVDGFYINEHGRGVVLEFMGCWHHFHTCKLNRGSTLHADAPERDAKRAQYIRERGFEIRVCWECAFDKLCDDIPHLKIRLNALKPLFYRRHPRAVSEAQIIKAVVDNVFYGFLLVNISVPDDLQPGFQRFPPLYANHDVKFQDVGKHMQNHIIQNNIKFKSRRSLISGMKAEHLLLSSELVRWYLLHGLRIDHIFEVIEFTPTKPFEGLVEFVTQMRRQADLDPRKKIKGAVAKLIGNSAYGGLLQDVSKHTDVKYTRERDDIRMAINQKRFKHVRPVGGDLYEIEMGKRNIRLKLPIYLGIHILNMAKLRMLAFAYDFVAVYLQPRLYNFILMDTDSLMINTGKPTLTECVKDEMREKYDYLLNGCCVDEPHPDSFLLRTCCTKHHLWDSRVGGQFKEELSNGRICIALCAKTYVAITMDQETKLTAKGVIKRSALVNSAANTFRRVMETHQTYHTINKGFRSIAGEILTYECKKSSFSYLYIKRECGQDGIHTRPLNVTLRPLPLTYCCLVRDAPELSPLCMEKKWWFSFHGATYRSIMHALTVLKLYHTADEKSFQSLNGELQTILRCSDESRLFKAYNSILSNAAWESKLDGVLFEIITHRLDQHTFLNTTLQSVQFEKIVFATEFSHVLGTGFSPRVTRWCSPAIDSGFNLVGKAYKKLRSLETH